MTPANEMEVEETARGVTVHRWVFSGDGESEPVQVEAAPGETLINIALAMTGTLVELGAGSSPGEGTCEK